MPNCTQAVHLTKQTCHYCLIVKLHPTMCLPKKMIMSSTAGTIAGIAAHVFLSNNHSVLPFYAHLNV